MRLLKEEIFDSSEILFRYNGGGQLLSSSHNHDFYEIFIVTQGSLKHERNGREELLDTGWMLFIRKEDVHCFPSGQQGQILNAAFTEKLYAEVTTLFRTGVREDAVKLEPGICSRYLRQFDELMSGEEADNADIRKKVLLIDMFSRFLGTEEERDPEEPLWFTAFLKKISRPGVFTGELKEVYRQTDRSPEHIARTFRRFKNMTLGEYLLSLRLQYAGNLLSLSDSPIIEICYETGFQNLSYFYRCFRKQYGVTPLAYRKHYSPEI